MYLAAKNGHGEAQCSIAIMCDAGIFSGAGKEDAVYWYTRAVEGGKITSQEYLFDAYSYLIEAYYYGDGVQKDIKKALKWAQLAEKKGHELAECILAAQGDSSKQHLLGSMYYFGSAVTKDIERARYWWEIASRQGYVPSQLRLADICDDKQRALELYQSAANTGDKSAQYRLGNFYFKNENYGEALKWLSLAAKKGEVEAQYRLAGCYEVGLGVKKDKQEAIKWFRLAAEKGLAKAQERLDDLEMMTCPHCFTKVKYGAGVCTGCRADIYYARRQNRAVLQWWSSLFTFLFFALPACGASLFWSMGWGWQGAGIGFGLFIYLVFVLGRWLDEKYDSPIFSRRMNH